MFHLGNANKRTLLKVAKGITSLRVGQNWTTSELYKDDNWQLQMQYRVLCDRGYYGFDCTTTCNARDDQFGHFVCSEDGQKVCISGWEGDMCNKGKIIQCFS